MQIFEILTVVGGILFSMLGGGVGIGVAMFIQSE